MWPIVFAVILVMVAVLVVSYPLVFDRLEPYDLPPPPDAEFNERDALLDAMSELELSYRSGKLSEQDYLAHKAQLEKQYLQVLEGAPHAGGAA